MFSQNFHLVGHYSALLAPPISSRSSSSPVVACRWRLIGKRKQGRASAILFVDQCPVGRNGRRVSKSTRWIRRLVGHLSDKRLCQRHKLPTYTLEGVKIREQLSFHYITNTKRCSSGVKSTLDSSHDDDSAYEYEYTICLPLKYEESSSFLPSVKAMGRENVGRLPNDHGSKIICPSWFSADEKCKSLSARAAKQQTPEIAPPETHSLPPRKFFFNYSTIYEGLIIYFLREEFRPLLVHLEATLGVCDLVLVLCYLNWRRPGIEELSDPYFSDPIARLLCHSLPEGIKAISATCCWNINSWWSSEGRYSQGPRKDQLQHQKQKHPLKQMSKMSKMKKMQVQQDPILSSRASKHR
ncbi:hypothetical protein Acr_00g0003740 [Actinidia rufa]|nr:hypothetical protein Acr_00g0003670 [Actinidia rufa]GFS28761.1 hypothetical protein Acr_00g0003740 [Actinidia rufa]